MPNDQYQLGELLGRGGMGQVHAARHRSGHLVAVKRVRDTLSSDRLLVERLTDEARLLRAISHPNVVRALDHGTGSDGMPFLVTDRAHGTSLHHLIAERGPLPLEQVAVIASQLFAGLAAIHAAHIVHADLKSHNVLVDDVDIVTIIDFGLARTLTDAPGTTDLVAGTPAYMAPEVISGAHPTITADVYSAATIVYEMLTGSTPFGGHISTILTRQLSESVEPPSQRAPHRRISLAIDRVVLHALDVSPAGRYPTVIAFAEALRAAMSRRPAEPAVGLSYWLEQPAVLQLSRSPSRDDTERLETSAIICAALAQAQRLIGEHQLGRAVEILEASLRALTPSPEAGAPHCTEVWRIETVLAALYDATGKQERARRLALVAYCHALRSGCSLAQCRAGALVDRLVARSRRVARGSVGGVSCVRGPRRWRLGSVPPIDPADDDGDDRLR
jgi:serine/threonine protein kinase